MKLLIMVTTMALLTGASFPEEEKVSSLNRYSESQKLEKAVSMLGKGDIYGAGETLRAICNGIPTPGVTDEALFRLALLLVNASAQRPSDQSQLLLLRLQKEFPNSPWTAQSISLLNFINDDGDIWEWAQSLQTDNHNLKATNQKARSSNQALANEISELKRQIKLLKRLDVELEKTTK